MDKNYYEEVELEETLDPQKEMQLKYENTHTICFSGSREFVWSPDSCKALREAVESIIKWKYRVIVGDCYGVDWAVIQALDKHGYTDITVVGAFNRCRKTTKSGTNINIPGNYLDRNQFMIDRADELIAFWDGKSRGTMHTMSCARRKGIEVEEVR